MKTKNNIFGLLALLAGIGSLIGCSKSDTYADLLEREGRSINAYIVKHGIKVISEEQFTNQDSITDLSKNEYVLFRNTGVYMQIVHKGTGARIEEDKTIGMLCRFTERNVEKDTLQLTNNVLFYGALVDKMYISNNSGTFSGWFDSSSSLMYTTYKTTAVPSGWLAAIPYLKIGRIEPLAHVRLIVPSTQGQKNAATSVYPCFYDLTFQRAL